jgi:hypothetical protein
MSPFGVRLGTEAIAQQRWRRRILPDCLAQAQEAVAQLRARGIPAEIKRDAWLVFDPEIPNSWAIGLLDQIWPRWRDCTSE